MRLTVVPPLLLLGLAGMAVVTADDLSPSGAPTAGAAVTLIVGGTTGSLPTSHDCPYTAVPVSPPSNLG